MDLKEMQSDAFSRGCRRSPSARGAVMNSLGLIYWLAGAGALALFVYLGYALLRPERF